MGNDLKKPASDSELLASWRSAERDTVASQAAGVIGLGFVAMILYIAWLGGQAT